MDAWSSGADTWSDSSPPAGTRPVRNSPDRSALERPGRAFWVELLFAAEQRARRLDPLTLVLEVFDPLLRPGELVRFVALDTRPSASVDQRLLLPSVKRRDCDVQFLSHI